jgi:hypothetical protein
MISLDDALIARIILRLLFDLFFCEALPSIPLHSVINRYTFNLNGEFSKISLGKQPICPSGAIG